MANALTSRSDTPEEKALIEMWLERGSEREQVALRPRRLWNLGSALVNDGQAALHRAEMSKVGIHVATHIPAPRIYPLSTHTISTDSEVAVHGSRTSGEVEPVVIVQDGVTYVGVGSDHTDRDLERHSIVLSKQVCDNVLAPVMWRWEDVSDTWSRLMLRSWVDGELYQEVEAGAFIAPDVLIGIIHERVDEVPDNFIIFAGTGVSVTGELEFGKRWRFELADPVGGAAIEHEYVVRNILDEVRPTWQVPLTS